MKIVRCVNCGNTFKKPWAKKYCSPKCRIENTKTMLNKLKEVHATLSNQEILETWNSGNQYDNCGPKSLSFINEINIPTESESLDRNELKNRGGRPGKPIHVYDEKYNYLYSFANQSEAFKCYNLKEGNLFGGKIFRLMPNGHYITKERLGRVGLARAVNIDACKFCKTFPSDKPVEIYNRVGEKIGEFRSFRELAEITRIPYNTIIRYYRDDVKNGGVRESIDRPLRIKLKN